MFKPRKTICAYDKEIWEKDKSKFNCTSSSNVYHCIQDETNRSGEICIQPVWVQPHYCPEYNTRARSLDTVPCNVTTGCPDVRFWSYEVYRYPVCLNKTQIKESIANDEDSLSLMWILGLLLPVTAVIFVLSCYIWRRKQKSQKKMKKHDPLLKDEEPFHKTAAFHEAVQHLKNGGLFLLLTGIWGSGKTKTATEVFRTITGRRWPIIVKDLFDLDKHNQSVIFDEAIPGNLSEEGKERFKKDITKWIEKVSVVEEKHFIIFASSSNNLKSYVSLLTSVVPKKNVKSINLSETLTRGDRVQILHSHFNAFCPEKDFSKIEDLALEKGGKLLGYSEICALFCRCNYFQKEKGSAFLKNPLYFLRSYLKQMYQSKDCNKFLLLVYMSLNHMEVDVENPSEMLFRILEICKSTNHIQEKLPAEEKIKNVGYEKNNDIRSLLSSEFVDHVGLPDSNIYRLQHEVIKRMTLVVFGTFHFDILLEYSSQGDLEGWIRQKGIFSDGDKSNLLLIDSREQWLQYEDKMKKKTIDK